MQKLAVHEQQQYYDLPNTYTDTIIPFTKIIMFNNMNFLKIIHHSLLLMAQKSVQEKSQEVGSKQIKKKRRF